MGKASRCWFSKLSESQLLALASAVGIAAAPRAALIAGLYGSALAAPYGTTYLSPISMTADDGTYFELETERDGGLPMDYIKAQCRERKLSSTGNRFKLVLALLQHDGAAARAAAAQAAAAAEKSAKRCEREKKRLRTA